ncbi:MAG: hypothetical protein EXR77_02325 [Myxococcales bacterium]|nr:hypothetical protein [Myxococcales bacterium]
MYGLLIVPPPPQVGAAAQALAQLLGGTAYDHRQALLRNLPYVPAWREAVSEIRSMTSALHQVGAQAWPIARAALEVGPVVWPARSFRLDRGGITLVSRSETVQIRWPDIGLALPCRADFGEATTTTTTTKKQSLMRLAMGVPIAGKKVEVEQERSTEHAFFCLVWARTAAPDGQEVIARLDAQGLDYAGLGEQKTGSSTANYLILIRAIEAAVGTAWDPRLERAGGKIVPIGAPPVQSRASPSRSTKVETVASSWDTDGAVVQAARLLIIAARLRAANAGRA